MKVSGPQDFENQTPTYNFFHLLGQKNPRRTSEKYLETRKHNGYTMAWQVKRLMGNLETLLPMLTV